MTVILNDSQRNLVRALDARSTAKTVKPRELYTLANQLGVSVKDTKAVLNMCTNVSHGVYDLKPVIALLTDNHEDHVTNIEISETAEDFAYDDMEDDNEIVAEAPSYSSPEDVFIPPKDKNFVRWGHYKDIERIIASRQFYPIYVTGHSGNGKTIMVKQACANLKREYMRVQITPETDEDDLIGGFRLVGGQTVFSDGPVIRAMRKGAVLLVDEIDRSSNRIMCLQGVLEGQPILIKKTGEIVEPAPGFTIIGTANTKGKGSDDGRYIAAAIIDDAFLERFTITMEQPYASAAVEKKIVMRHMKHFGAVDEDFATKLCTWSEMIRKTFDDGGVDDMISTRRLCHIVQTFSIFGDRKKSVALCVSRFDTDTKAAFLDVFSKVDAPASEDDAIPEATVELDGDLDPDEFVRRAKIIVQQHQQAQQPTP